MSSGLLRTPPTPEDSHRNHYQRKKKKMLDSNVPPPESTLLTPPPTNEWSRRIPELDASNNPFLDKETFISSSSSKDKNNFYDNDNPFWEPNGIQATSSSTSIISPTPTHSARDTVTYVFRGKKITYQLGQEDDSLRSQPRLLWPETNMSSPRGKKRPAEETLEESREFSDDEGQSHHVQNHKNVHIQRYHIPDHDIISSNNIHSNSIPNLQTELQFIPQTEPQLIPQTEPQFIPQTEPQQTQSHSVQGHRQSIRSRRSSSLSSSSLHSSSENDIPHTQHIHPNILQQSESIAPRLVPTIEVTHTQSRKLNLNHRAHMTKASLKASTTKRTQLMSAFEKCVTSSAGSFKNFR